MSQCERSASPFHQRRQPAPVGNIRHDTTMAAALAAIRAIGRNHGCIAYLYVLSNGDVYVISDERPAAAQWMLDHVDHWRGCYTRRVTIEDLAADLA